MLLQLGVLAISFTLASAGRNDFYTNWQENVPQCEKPKQCGRYGQCPEQQVCVDKYDGVQYCERIWKFSFCRRGCPESELGPEFSLVVNPMRFCSCITP